MIPIAKEFGLRKKYNMYKVEWVFSIYLSRQALQERYLCAGQGRKNLTFHE